MLINEIGIEDDSNVVDLDERREKVAVDPKVRVTMTMVLQAALTANAIEALAPPPQRERVVTHLAKVAADKKTSGNGAQADVA